PVSILWSYGGQNESSCPGDSSGTLPLAAGNRLVIRWPSSKVYASAMCRRERLFGVALREFDAAFEWAAMGNGEPASVESEPSAEDSQPLKTAQQSLFR